MVSLAFSVHNFISSVGADAGFAAIIGLAILILLYFAHARETANLRDEAATLSERLQDAEARVAQLTRGQAGAPAEAGAAPAPTAPPAPAPARVPAAAPAIGLASFAPAGTGAPALAAATRVVPLAPSVPELSVVPAVAAAPVMASVAPAPATAPAPPAASAAEPAPSAAEPAPSAAAVATEPGVPAPATAAGGGNGAGDKPAAPPPVAPGSGWSPPPGGTASRPILGDLPPLDGGRTRRPWFGRGLVVALAALAVVAAVVAVVAVTSVGGSTKNGTGARTTNTPGSSPSKAAPAFKPSSVTVAVLNGTSTNQLAHHIGDRLAASGYKQGTIATAANQTETTTVVAYLPGATNRKDAQHVAAALGLHQSAVRPVDQSTLQVACPASTSCTANVVVTVGADLATS